MSGEIIDVTVCPNMVCSMCGREATQTHYSDGTSWWDIPCPCGSQLFDVRIEKPLWHRQISGINLP